jgi:predicted signal transduction protein with EAL and GGDEF domain
MTKLAGDLMMAIIVECFETAAERDNLEKLGCDLIQGLPVRQTALRFRRPDVLDCSGGRSPAVGGADRR